MAVRYNSVNLLRISLVAALALTACVDHRPVRNGLSDESIYLTKSDLTAANPLVEGTEDANWLFKVTTVKSSSPNVLGDVIFPGLESELRLVKFRFQEGAPCRSSTAAASRPICPRTRTTTWPPRPSVCSSSSAAATST